MATPTAVTNSPGGQIGGESSPISNGSASNIQSFLRSGQLSGDLKNLVSLLGSQSGSGITLEQLLSATSSTSRLTTPTAANPNPTTPQSTGTWGSGRKRGRTSYDSELHPKRRRGAPSSARPTGDKSQGKGLRHFSQRVCEKVREKGTTSYNEVADELVKELSESESTNGAPDMPIDQKNIRRRVYDALNVLMAMNIISKEKKEIKWIGLPTNSVQECQHIEEELSKVEQRVLAKRNEVENLIVQILSFKNLMKRNRERVASLGAPTQNSSIALPFILVNTSKKTTIDCSITSDKSEYVFHFDNAFELHNDIEVLKKMGLDCGLHSGTCTADSIKTAKSMLPKAFATTLDDIVSTKSATTVPISATPSSTPGILSASSPFTPQGTPTVSESPLARDQVMVSLGHSLRSSSHSPALKPSSPVVVPSNPICGIPSPQAVTALVSSVMRGGKVPINKANGSPGLSAKAVMHSHCPSSSQQVSVSPLVKSSAGSIDTQSSSSQQSTGRNLVGGHGSPSAPQASQHKVVTVSKLPSPEQLTSLLQQLQQNSSLSKLISTAANTVSASRQLFNSGSGSSKISTTNVQQTEANSEQATKPQVEPKF